MSAPDTNLDKQKRRHWGPIFGIATVVTFAGVLFLAFFGSQTDLSADDSVEVVPEVSVSE